MKNFPSVVVAATISAVPAAAAAQEQGDAHHEIDQITVIRMAIDEATAKVKDGGVVERSEADYDIATWAGVIPIAQTVGAAVPDDRLRPGTSQPANVAAYGPGRRLDEALAEARAQAGDDGEA